MVLRISILSRPQFADGGRRYAASYVALRGKAWHATWQGRPGQLGYLWAGSGGRQSSSSPPAGRRPGDSAARARAGRVTAAVSNGAGESPARTRPGLGRDSPAAQRTDRRRVVGRTRTDCIRCRRRGSDCQSESTGLRVAKSHIFGPHGRKEKLDLFLASFHLGLWIPWNFDL